MYFEKTQAEQTRQLWAWSVPGNRGKQQEEEPTARGEGPRGLQTPPQSTLHQGALSVPDLQPVQTRTAPNTKTSLIYSS